MTHTDLPHTEKSTQVRNLLLIVYLHYAIIRCIDILGVYYYANIMEYFYIINVIVVAIIVNYSDAESKHVVDTLLLTLCC